MKRPFISPHKIPAVFAMVGAMMLGGMVAGDAIGSVPMLTAEADGPGSGNALLTDADAGWRPSERPMNDQFAITTPDGRYETSELAQRGLYSQPRFGGGAETTERSAWNQWEAQDAAIRHEMAYWSRQSSENPAAHHEDRGDSLPSSAAGGTVENGVEVVRASDLSSSSEALPTADLAFAK